MADSFLLELSTTVENIDVNVALVSAESTVIEYFFPQGPPGINTWGSILGTLSTQTDLWRDLSAKALEVDLQSLSGQVVDLETFIATVSSSWNGGQEALTVLVGNSAFWDTAFARSTVFSSVSSHYDSSSTVVESNSANWNFGYDVATYVQANSANWEESSEIIPTVTNYLSTVPVTLSSVDVKGQLLSAGTDLFDIFLTSETDSQTLSYIPSSYSLSISNGNTVNLSSINTTFAANSGKYENVYSNVVSNSANWNNAYNTGTVYQANSGNYAPYSFVNSNFLNLTGGTIVGDLTLLSNLFVNGSAIYVNTQDLIVSDPLIYIAEGNPDDSLDIGIMAAWVDPVSAGGVGYQHGGLVRRVDEKVWTLFRGATAEPLSGVNVDWFQPGIQLEPLSAKFYGDIYGDRNVFGSLSSTGPVYGSNLNIANWDTAFNRSTVFSSVSGRYNNSSTVVESNSANWILDGGNTKNSNITIGTNDNFDLNFETANSTRVTIDTSGNVGIGTTTPTTSLEVSGTIKARKTETGFQDSVLKILSTEYSNGTGWRGRALIGAEDLTFLMGTYNGIAGLGAHRWTSANNETGDSWADLTINPDGSADVYIGGSGWDNSTAILTVKNSTTNVGIGTVSPEEKLTVSGNISASGIVYAQQGNSQQWDTAFDRTTQYQSVSSTFATNSTVSSVSSQLVLNTDFDNYKTNVAAATATLLPTTIYQNASGNWEDTYTTFSQNSATYCTKSLALAFAIAL